ncbi:MAG: DUF1698 domain-containing protein [bacterium]
MNSVKDEIAKVKFWRHTIELPGGIITPGTQDSIINSKLFQIPKDLTGMRVLDIGCSDGAYSFECEKRGALEVIAIDDFSSVFIDAPNGFHVAHKLLNSKVKFYQSSMFDLDSKVTGQFDLILFLGVLYHLQNPMLALEKLSAICRGQIILETLLAPENKAMGNRSYIEFYEEDEINKDPTVWCAPTLEALKAMLRSVGFCNVVTVHADLNPPLPSGIVHAFTPSKGSDAEEFIEKNGTKIAMISAKEILGVDVEPDHLLATLKKTSVAQFARIKNAAMNLKAKQYHQEERWK